ncbi:MAG: DUF3732 domain-containing protein [Snodgrassella sp.]|nr:DUF3732 domain-containing protein [Snodgrassella sp.]
MKFTLHEIKLWFKNKNFEPKSYYFLPNKVNVITGNSNTGKSSFFNIIDYCLISDQVKIATPIINAVEWFGINFSISNENLFIARKSANNGAPSFDLFLDKSSFPELPYKNSNSTEIINLLNETLNITDELKNNFNISYRDFLLFNSLTENIIASQEVYFDTSYFEREYQKGSYIDKLKEIFNLVTGITTFENIITQSKLKKTQKYIENTEEKKRKNEENNVRYKESLKKLLDECKNNKLLDESISFDSAEEIVNIIESIIPDVNNIEDNNVLQEIDKLKNQRNNLQSELFLIRKYQKECNNYRNSLIKSADSLQPIDFLYRNLQDQIIYPLEAKEFLQNLEYSLKKIKNKTSVNYVIPDSIESEINFIQEQIKLVDEEIARRSKITNITLLENRNNCFILGKIKEKLENIKKSYSPKTIKEKKLADNKELKQELLDALASVKTMRRDIINQLNSSIQFFYCLIDSIPVYKNYATKFDLDEMSLRLYPPNDMFPIGNLGSKSNFMFMHLYFYLGLHAYLFNVVKSYVPQFLFIDQPSIPYYQGGNDDLKLTDAFHLLNEFIDLMVSKKNGDFQIFMVEHASKDNWENILEHFHTVEEFINGNALIPQQLIKE